MNPQNWGAEVALKTLLIAIVKRMSKVRCATSVRTNTMDSHGMILKDVRYYTNEENKRRKVTLTPADYVGEGG